MFGSDRIKAMMGRFGIPEDQPIENSLINKSLEGAQKKIEGFHFDARKYTLEYDNVLSHQRGIVYSRRRTMLLAEKESIEAYLAEFLAASAATSPELGDALKAVIEEKQKAIGEDSFLETFRRIVLYVTDLLWVEHLESMDYLRSSVNLRAYGGREPLVEYQREGLRLFRDMEAAFRAQVSELIGTINANQPMVSVSAQPVVSNLEMLKAVHQEALGNGLDLAPVANTAAAAEMASPTGSVPKVGRNDPCPCGSGKKYKNCHLNGN